MKNTRAHVSHLSLVIGHWSFVICHLSFVICHLSFVIWGSDERREQSTKIEERLIDFAVRVIKVADALPKRRLTSTLTGSCCVYESIKTAKRK